MNGVRLALEDCDLNLSNWYQSFTLRRISASGTAEAEISISVQNTSI